MVVAVEVTGGVVAAKRDAGWFCNHPTQALASKTTIEHHRSHVFVVDSNRLAKLGSERWLHSLRRWLNISGEQQGALRTLDRDHMEEYAPRDK